MHLSYEGLKKTHGDKALEVYNEIAVLVGGDPIQGQTAHEGGISLSGAMDPNNPSFTAAERKKITDLLTPPTKEKEGNK